MIGGRSIYYVLKYLNLSSLIKLGFSYLLTIDDCYVLSGHTKDIIEASALRKPAGELRKINDDDIIRIENSIKSLNPKDKKYLINLILFYRSGFKNCYIFLKSHKIAYLQWLIFPHENVIIEKHYKKKYFKLKPNQAMVENAFAFPEFRGQGILPFVTRELAKIADDQGKNLIITYIKKDKIASLNELIKMGFKIARMVGDYKLIGFSWRTLD